MLSTNNTNNINKQTTQNEQTNNRQAMQGEFALSHARCRGSLASNNTTRSGCDGTLGSRDKLISRGFCLHSLQRRAKETQHREKQICKTQQFIDETRTGTRNAFVRRQWQLIR